jgi:ATP synthase F1 epsilon subunit
MQFQLVSITGTKYDAEAYEVLVPTLGGTIAIFKDHMPLISAAQPGVLSVRKKAGDPDSELENFAINGGVVHVDGKTVYFIADDVTAPDELSEQEATAALRRAEELVKSAGSQTALAEAQHLLRHSSAKLQVARLKKRHHR